MDNLKLEISDYYDMLNLHKALLEAKFHQNPDNEYVAGSPIISKICNELVSLMAEYDIKKKGKENWTQWRKLENQGYYRKRAIEAINRSKEWEKLDFNEKKDIVRNYVSPFTCTDDDAIALIKEVDKICCTE